MARIVVGITGGIAAYKACEVIRRLVQQDHDVLPILTRGAERFITAETVYALARRAAPADPYPHLARADVLVVAPLTAHTLARLAHGLADDVLTEAALAHRGPLVVAPAMNTGMWEHPATQANLATVRERGAVIVGPAAGELAEGEVGIGRMAEPAEIVGAVELVLRDVGGPGAPAATPAATSTTAVVPDASLVPPTRPQTLADVHVLVTAGGTREPLDSVRFLGNRSSGRMGVALAREARARGAHVTLLAANLQVAAPDDVDVVRVETAADLRREALERADADVILMAAAVADYRPAQRIDGKRAKDGDPWSVELVPTADVAKALGAARRTDQILVAFGAESGADGLERKRRMLSAKNVDLVVFNDIGREDIGFDSVDNEVVLLSATEQREVSKRSKEDVAAAILDEVERLRSAR